MQLFERAKATAVEGQAILAAAKQYASAAAMLQPADSSCSDGDSTEPQNTVTRVWCSLPSHILSPEQHQDVATSSACMSGASPVVCAV